MSESTISSVSEMFPGKVKRRYIEETAPVSGMRFRFQSLLAGEVSRYQSSLMNKNTRRMTQRRLETAEARLIVLMAVDENGTVLMNEKHAEKMASEWDYADIAYLVKACATHSGIDQDEIEDLVKNSDGVQFGSEKSESGEAVAG